jgi:hypothetical protein
MIVVQTSTYVRIAWVDHTALTIAFQVFMSTLRRTTSFVAVVYGIKRVNIVKVLKPRITWPILVCNIQTGTTRGNKAQNWIDSGAEISVMEIEFFFF